MIKSTANKKSDLSDRTFWIPTEQEIKRAVTTDVYFEYAEKALEYAKINPKVSMEFYTRGTKFDSNWGILCGVYEVAKLLEGVPVDVHAMEEGELFLTDPKSSIYEPVIRVTGRYRDFARYENPILGFICQASGICTKASRIAFLAQGKTNVSFGTRRAHPALAAMIERSCFIGGLDRVSNVLGAKLLNQEPSGTMPHAFILCVGDEVEAWKIFDKAIPKSVPRIALVDTLSDEKFAAINALETFGKNLSGVRLDTPSSRRGDMRRIVQEVRWELNARGGDKVKIIVSGGLDEKDIVDLRDYVDGFGIGTSVSTAPVIDFGGKIVEVVNEKGARVLRSKRGDLSGKKFVFRDKRNMKDLVTLKDRLPSGNYIPLLTPLIRDGKIVRRFMSVDQLRKRTAELVREVSKKTPQLTWA